MKRFRSFWLYGLFLLALMVIAAETGLRIKGTYKTYAERNHGRYYSEAGKRVDRYLAHEPNRNFFRKQREFNYEYRINSLGFRESEIDTTDFPRVFVFGDSFVEGVGAPQDSTWPRVLERMLRDDHPAAGVYVCGTSGSDPFFNYMNLEERLLAYDPTHVIFSVNSSDLNDFLSRGGFGKFASEKAKISYPPAPWFEPLFHYSHLFRAWLIGYKRYGFDLLPPGRYAALEAEAIRSIDKCLSRADSLCQARGIGFLAVIHPMALEACLEDSMYVPAIQRLEAGLEGAYSRVSLTVPMRELLTQNACKHYYWPVDGHFNAAGYNLLAREVYSAAEVLEHEFFSVSNPLP